MEPTEFKNATRAQSGFLTPVERKVLKWLARRTPLWIRPDHLTLIGFVAMFLAGVFYGLSRWDARFLHGVNFWLLINWLGDSLDGTLARYRNKQRPRYGFYVDHMVDTFGTFFLIGGLAFSGYMSERIAFGVLVVYFMLAIQVYLATYTLGTFQLSFWKLSPTELRLLLVLGNLILLLSPHAQIYDRTYLLYDVGGVIGIAGMAWTLITSSIRNTKILYDLEQVS
jgi:phosphatidylglycerophosphate synthase